MDLTTLALVAKRYGTSVKKFGARGDGITDDAAAIQNALNSGNKYIYFPEGTYIVGTKLSVLANTAIVGSGFGSVIKCADSTNIVMMELNDVDDVIIENLKFDGNAANNSYGGPAYHHCLHIYQGERVVVNNVLFVDNIFSGIWMNGTNLGSQGPVISNCYFSGFNALGASCGLLIDERAEYSRIIGCKAQSCAIGFRVAGGGNHVLSGCMAVMNCSGSNGVGFKISRSNREGLDAANPGKTILTGCHSNHNNRGILVDDVFNAEIIGCHVIANNYDGLVLSGVNHCIVNGCSISANSDISTGDYDEIVLKDKDTSYSTHNIISNNIIHSYSTIYQARYGINEDSANCDFNLISSNIVQGQLTGRIRTQGTSTVKDNNIEIA